MSTVLSAPMAVESVERPAIRGRLLALLKSWWLAYVTWRIEQAAIRHLMSLSDHQLKDIGGLSRAGIESAVRGGRRAARPPMLTF